MPLRVLATAEVLDNAPVFRRIIEDHQPDLLLCGIPVSLSGAQQAQAEWVRIQAEAIAGRSGLPLAFQDERLSSREAKRILRENGHTERTMRGKTDMIAASLFLQAYLDGIVEGRA
jgi:putative Holliday junction resolvase